MAFSPTSFTSGAKESVGINAHIFQPPDSPACATTTPSSSTVEDYFSSRSRKRPRADSSRAHRSSYLAPNLWTTSPSWPQCPTPSDGSYTNRVGRDSVVVNERYRLAGGFDTPSLQATMDMERLQVAEQDEVWRHTRDERPELQLPGDGMLSGPLARERNGVARSPLFQDGVEKAQSSWTGLAFDLVGKVFTFGTSVIRGFYAGGGEGFDLKHSPSAPNVRQIRGPCSTPLPGSWQEDEFLGDFEQDNPHVAQSMSRPQNKRRQTDRDAWVLVGTPEATIGTSPKRKLSSTSIPRSSLASRPGASRASSGRGLTPALRRQTSHLPYSPGSPTQSPFIDGSRRASFAPARSPLSRPSSAHNGYISPDVERYAKRQARQERATDKTVNSMSRRLEDLIRQGQEALGTKVSVEGTDETDAGFVDEEW